MCTVHSLSEHDVRLLSGKDIADLFGQHAKVETLFAIQRLQDTRRIRLAIVSWLKIKRSSSRSIDQ